MSGSISRSVSLLSPEDGVGKYLVADYYNWGGGKMKHPFCTLPPTFWYISDVITLERYGMQYLFHWPRIV